MPRAGVLVRMVPGITAALAGRLCLSLTHRRHAQRVQFVTGHDRHGQLPPHLDLTRSRIRAPRPASIWAARPPPPWRGA